MFETIVTKLNSDYKGLTHKLYANVTELESNKVMLHTSNENIENDKPHWTTKDGVMGYTIMSVGEFVDWLYNQHDKGYEINLSEIQ